jgi:hypothetical protein
MFTVSRSRRLVAICVILSDLGEGSDNTLSRIFSPILDAGCALSFSLILTCKLQVISVYLFFLTFPKPEITRRASQIQAFQKKTAGLMMRALLFCGSSGGRSAA